MCTCITLFILTVSSKLDLKNLFQLHTWELRVFFFFFWGGGGVPHQYIKFQHVPSSLRIYTLLLNIGI